MSRPKPTLPVLLERLCRPAYGAEWQSDLAHDLNVHRTTVARWAAGSSHLQQWYLDQVLLAVPWRAEYNLQVVRRQSKLIKTLSESSYYDEKLKLPENIPQRSWKLLEDFAAKLRKY